MRKDSTMLVLSITIAMAFAFGFLLQEGEARARPQNEDYEEETEDQEEEKAGEVAVAVATTKKPLIDPGLMKMNFSEQFNLLAAQAEKYQQEEEAGIHLTSTSASKVVAAGSNGSSNKTGTTRKPQRSTTELSRGQEIGQGVNGILSSVGALNIPGIVDSALSIRNDGPVREFVSSLMHAIFCAPLLNNLSSCGGRLGSATAKPAGIASAAA